MMRDQGGEPMVPRADAARDQGGAAHGDQDVVANDEPGEVMRGRLRGLQGGLILDDQMPREIRSEERRVGKECRL